MPSSSQYVCPSKSSLINEFTRALVLPSVWLLSDFAFFEGEGGPASFGRFGAITLDDTWRQRCCAAGKGLMERKPGMRGLADPQSGLPCKNKRVKMSRFVVISAVKLDVVSARADRFRKLESMVTTLTSNSQYKQLGSA